MKNYLNESLSAQERAEALVNEMTVEEAASQLRYDAPAVERLRPSPLNWWDGVSLIKALLWGASVFLPITGGMRVSMGLHEAVLPPCFHRQ